MSQTQEVAVAETKEAAPLTAQEIKSQVQLIQEVMQAVMQEGYHYGVIPGTDKPTLLKPGAEKLTTTFRLAPLLHVETRELGNGHREYQVRCTLVHIPTARVYGEGVGSCSTLESRYRYRNADRTCPYCGRTTIIKGKAEYGGGWLCFQRKGGCGAKFADQDISIVSQAAGRVENNDLADTYNTVLKMAKKRALVDATLTATAASDIFNQDLDDYTPPELAEAIRTGTVPPQPSIPTVVRQTQPAAGTAATNRPVVSEAVHAETVPPQPSVPTVVRQTQPSASTTTNRAITKGQLEILLMSQRRSRVSEAEFKRHVLEACQVVELKELKQKDVNGLLEWLETQHEKRVDAVERQAAAVEN